MGVPKAGTYKRLLTTESGETKEVKYKAKKGECDGMPYSLDMPLHPFESVIFEFPKVAATGKSHAKSTKGKKAVNKK